MTALTIALFIVIALVLLVLLALLFDRLAPAQAARAAMACERLRAGLRRREAQVPGAHMPYLDGGSGEPVVLLHGFGGDKDHYTRVAAHLTGAYRVIIPDLPGFGEASRNPQASHSMAAQAANVLAFIDALGLRRVHLGGSSMGGFIAAEFAARYPERVASLWLLNSAGTATAIDCAMVRRYTATGEMSLLLRSPDRFSELLDEATVRMPFLPYSVRHELGRRGHADLALHTSLLKQMHASPYVDSQYYRIEAPALIVWGDGDKMMNPKGAEALQAIMPNSRIVLMPGVGHLPMVEAPRASAADYLAFLHALPAGLARNTCYSQMRVNAHT
jgi:pimeloyl-ACP methyl ester carboxylesterase